MDGEAFSGLVWLKKLKISNCYIFLKRIKREFFECMPMLEVIEMVGNSIESIGPGAFSCLPYLKHLNLSLNKLERCPSLSELASLQKLDLGSNKIKSIDGLFEGIASDEMNTELRVLDLTENELTSLSANIFSRLASLTRLILRENPITVVPNGSFNGLLNLRILDFASNDGIESIDLCMFDCDLANLRILNLPWSLKTIEVNDDSLAKKSFKHFRNTVVLNIFPRCVEVGGSILEELKKSGVIA
jgi:Leucine-rich repeat (LRR) protein